MKYIIGNWKMNKTAGEIVEFTRGLKKYKFPKDKDIIFGLAVPYVYLLGMSKLQVRFWIGAQNVSEHSHGAYTGEISAEMLADVGLDFCIVGHSERRTLYHESDAIVNEKLKQLQEYDMLPILCIGETLEEFEAGKTHDVLSRQIREALKGLDLKKEMIVAYEPVWAIGTGKSATAENIKESVSFIKSEIKKVGADYPVLYGGSVNPANASEILHIDCVDGALIGGASLDPDRYVQIASALYSN